MGRRGVGEGEGSPSTPVPPVWEREATGVRVVCVGSGGPVRSMCWRRGRGEKAVRTLEFGLILDVFVFSRSDLIHPS